MGQRTSTFTGVMVAAALVALPVLVIPASAVGAAALRQEVSGTGPAVPALAPIKEPVIVRMTHDGASNFIVHPVDATGEEGFSWANEIGPWTGTVFQSKEAKPIVAASVEADGGWTITISPLSSAPRVNPKGYKGAGTMVVKFAKPSTGLKRITLTHAGESNFIVHPISGKGAEGFSLANEIGSFSGTKLLRPGTQYLSVIADGEWTLKVS